jgi:hypothetical protein
MARDYYADAMSLAATLAERGYHKWSQQLTDTMAAGATATEIVMGLRWILARMLQEEDCLPANLREEARQLHQGLDRSLR